MNLNFLEEESAFIIEEQNDFLFDEEKILADFAKYDRLARFVYHNHDEILWKNFDRKEKGRKKHPTGNRNVKRSKKLHKADRKHGKHRELTRKEQDLVHYDATKGVHGAGVWYTSRGKKVIPIVSKGAKTNRNYHTKKYDYPTKEREQEYADLFTEHGEILSYVYEMKEDLARLEREISVLEEEKRWGYLTEKGVDILEEYKEDAIQLENHIKVYMVFCATAIR